ncbi:flagellar protein [Amphibacillus sp. MSJ-3]|uniref:TIGR02530 family flagellar biosynthesis protein n=1 Tax=Amphibacillus sp. MSJ-3 TaxID=2841505 RepID=UPI001C0EC66E|nr:TIGR02530 family flagellar biosynthesis protein [Amphibacillus sp. MSJ-3]MBU5594963.1 flagellar protein [Amphibacillus sp. MSJ-3]
MDHRIQQVPSHALLQNKQPKIVKTNSQASSFQTVLGQTQTQLKISKHAQDRLNERNINISSDKWNEIADQVKEAKKKGITNSLVITNEATLLVSAKNHTVVTALDRDEAESRIFTNINGTILLD